MTGRRPPSFVRLIPWGLALALLAPPLAAQEPPPAYRPRRRPARRDRGAARRLRGAHRRPRRAPGATGGRRHGHRARPAADRDPAGGRGHRRGALHGHLLQSRHLADRQLPRRRRPQPRSRTCPSAELRESELGLQAVVDPYARADFFLAFGEEGVEVEEGFVTFTALPAGLLAKVGPDARRLRQGQHAAPARPALGRPAAADRQPAGRRGGLDRHRRLGRPAHPAPATPSPRLTLQVFRGDAEGLFEARDAERPRLQRATTASSATSPRRRTSTSALSYGRGPNGTDARTPTPASQALDAHLRWKPLQTGALPLGHRARRGDPQPARAAGRRPGPRSAGSSPATTSSRRRWFVGRALRVGRARRRRRAARHRRGRLSSPSGPASSRSSAPSSGGAQLRRAARPPTSSSCNSSSRSAPTAPIRSEVTS